MSENQFYVTIAVERSYQTMNLDQLKTFVIVYDVGSFSKAERTASLSKQSMYKQIAGLENEIGCPLFERGRSGITPTPAGRVLYRQAQDLLSLWSTTVSSCRKAGRAEFIRIGSVEHQVLLNPVNEAFARKYPDIELRRIVHPEHSGEFRVSHNIMDVGETFLINEAPYASIYQFTPLLKMPFLAAMAQNHPLAERKSVTLAELSRYETLICPLMLEKEFLADIRAAFAARAKNLLETDDVDNQVAAAFACSLSKRILITANPFIYSVSSLVTVPLASKAFRTYGLICMSPHTPAVDKYIETAKRVYTVNPFKK